MELNKKAGRRQLSGFCQRAFLDVLLVKWILNFAPSEAATFQRLSTSLGRGMFFGLRGVFEAQALGQPLASCKITVDVVTKEIFPGLDIEGCIWSWK